MATKIMDGDQMRPMADILLECNEEERPFIEHVARARLADDDAAIALREGHERVAFAIKRVELIERAVTGGPLSVSQRDAMRVRELKAMIRDKRPYSNVNIDTNKR